MRLKREHPRTLTGQMMTDDRLNRVARRLRDAGDEYERQKAEEKRKAEEAAERMRRVEQGWQLLQGKRQEVVDEINSALSDSGFQLQMSSGLGVANEDEIDYFVVTVQGRPHPQLEATRLRVSLKATGSIAADVMAGTKSRRLKTLTYEEFMPPMWRDLLLEHLEKIGFDEEAQSSGSR